MDSAATHMCEEILIEILSRLPAKSLVRFMAVCRFWQSVITSPQFRLLSTKLLVHTDGECYSLVENGYQNRLMFETDSPLKHYSFDEAVVIGSDNGLVCIKTTSTPCILVIIWNPSIRKHVVIPHHPMDDEMRTLIECAFGFGGTISGGGGDYKYVRVASLLGDGEASMIKAVDIFSLKAGTWRRKYLDADITPVFWHQFLYSSALVRGRLHWVGGGRTNRILAFDLEDEVFEDKFMVPESVQPNDLVASVLVIRESLAVLTNVTGHQCFAVWVMEVYGDVNSWVKLCNIDLTMDNFCKGVVPKMVHLLKDGDLLLGLVETNTYPPKRKLVTYNPETMKTCDFGGGELSSFCGFTNYYKESLVLLSGDYRAATDKPTLQGRSQHGHFPVRTQGNGASSYPLDHSLPMFFQPATFFLGYYPVWTGGPGFHSYPLFQDRNGSYYAWTGFNWLHVINYYPLVQ